MKIFKLATLNILRNRRRTIITTGSVAFGVWLAASFVGTREHTYKRLVDSAARQGSGHMTLATKKYFEAPGPAHPLPKTAELTAALMVDQPGLKVFPHILGNAIVASAERSSGITYLGIDPAGEDVAHNIFLEKLTPPGALIEDNVVIPGKLLAAQLGVVTGDRLVLTTSDRAGQVNSHLVIVGGIFDTGNQETDGSVVLVANSFMRKVLNYADSEVSLLAIYVDGFSNIAPVFRQLSRTISDPVLQIDDWHRTHRDLSQFIRYDSAVYRILIFFVGIIIVSGILNTLVISIIERRRELGVMLAVGMAPAKIFGLVVAEGVLLGTSGVLAGALSFVPLYFYLNQIGIDLTGLLSETINAGGVTIAFIMKCELTVGQIGIIAGSILLLTVLSSIYPAWKAATIEPVRSLHQ